MNAKNAKDLLLPGLVDVEAKMGPGLLLDLSISAEGRIDLLLEADGRPNARVCLLEPHEIADGSYRDKFGERMTSISGEFMAGQRKSGSAA